MTWTRSFAQAALAAAVVAGLLPAIPAAQAAPDSSVAASADAPSKAATKLDIPLDVHLGYKPQKQCSPAAKPGAKALLKTLIKNFGGKSLGISRSCGAGGRSEHKEGRALDWARNVKYASQRRSANKALKWLTANNGEVARRLGVMYIIWNQRIWSTYYPEMGWRKMASRGSYTANHKDHVHISLSWDGAMQRTSWWTGKPVLSHPCTSKACPKGHVKYPQLTLTRPFAKKVAPEPFVPYPGPMPEISGSPIVGQILGVSIGNDKSWSPAWRLGKAVDCPKAAKCSYQWYRGKKKIRGATAATYRVRAADKGKCLNVEVTIRYKGKTGKKKAGETTYTIKGWVTKAPAPKLPKTAAVGDKLVARHDPWQPTTVKPKYQWLRDGKPIKGATAKAYVLKARDLNHKIAVRLTGSAKQIAAKSVTSNATKVGQKSATPTPPT
ncbi:MAG: hypothetical protein LBR32_10095 [Propionibacteriaceae bacterium]|jgi:hypothetical protein|nr:hypothetical protein [Propionibacteriaceae bacterium]